nr:MAG TPA: hypothetical protein [Caudoviricetes sp.]
MLLICYNIFVAFFIHNMALKRHPDHCSGMPFSFTISFNLSGSSHMSSYLPSLSTMSPIAQLLSTRIKDALYV